MPKGNRYQWNYNKLNRLTGNIKKFASKPGNTLKLQSSCFMDLHVESLGNNIISLSHYYRQNGDSIPDPDMTIKVYDHGVVEALTYQDSFGYQQVYTDDGQKYYPKLKQELNQFLDFWLTNLWKQGFYK